MKKTQIICTLLALLLLVAIPTAQAAAPSVTSASIGADEVAKLASTPSPGLPFAPGERYSLYLTNDGSVYMWEYGYSGEMPKRVPIQGTAGKSVAVAVGSGHCIALMSDGSVYAWGDNSEGQLGNGSKSESAVPTKVKIPVSAGKVAAIAAGGQYNLALMSDGSVYGWGINKYVPEGSTNYVYNGGNFYVAINGTSYGPIISSDEDPTIPVKIKLPDKAGKAVSVAVSDRHSLALMEDGSLYAWGYNDASQLGDGSNKIRLEPVKVEWPTGADKPIAIATGKTHNFALTKDGSVYTWGNNNYGKLGDGTYDKKDVPAKIEYPFGKALSISAGGTHSIALSKKGELYAWGNNYANQLGDGSQINSLVPQRVVLPAGEIVAISAGSASNMVLMSDGRLYAWGLHIDGKTPVQVLVPKGLSIAMPL